MSGVNSGVIGTPTFFINGVRHDGSWELASLLAALERADHSQRAHLQQPESRPVSGSDGP